MMKKLFFLLLLVCAGTTISFAQGGRRATVSGTVIDGDDKTPVGLATVQLLSLPDSAMVTGNLTNDGGAFSLAARPGKYVLKISFVGYQTQLKPVQLAANKPVNLGKVVLPADAIMLSEAVVVAAAPEVTVSEDTIGYNASAYRTPQGAMVEELVKKLPGAEVDDEGNITMNGKEVKKLMVNGKEYFGGDVKTGLKNLPADMVEKLKTYEKKSDLARITGIDDGEEETVLDLTVKKNMNKGWVGNADLGVGTEDRYAGRAMINHFNDKTYLSVIGSANNVNDRGFSGGGGGPRFRRSNGLTATKMLGATFATETDKLDMDGSVRYNYSDADALQTGQEENFLSGGNSFRNSNSHSRNKAQNVNANFRLEWKPDSMTNIIFRPNFSWSSSDSRSTSEAGTFNADPYLVVANPNDYLGMGDDAVANEELDKIRVNSSSSSSLGESKSLSGQATLQVNRKLNNKGRNITFRGSYSLGDSESDQYSSQLTRYYEEGRLDTIRRYISTPGNNHSYQAQLTYSEPIARATFLQFSYRFQYSYSESDKSTYGMPYGWEAGDALPDRFEELKAGLKDEDQSKYAEYKTYEHNANVSLRFIRQKWQLNTGLQFRPQRTVLSYKKGEYATDTVRNVFNFAPNVDFRYRFSKLSDLRVMYRGRSSQPGMENLLPVTDNSNPLNIRMGNPGLKPSFSHNLSAFYKTNNVEKQQSIFTHANASFTQNSISNSRSYDASTGAWTSQPKNINGQWNAFGMFGFNTALKNKKFTMGSFSSLRYSNNVGYLTDQQTKVEQKNTTTEMVLGERLRANYRNDWLDFGLNGSLSYSIEKDKLRSENNQEPYTFSYGANTTLNAPWGMSFSTNIMNQSRRGYSDSSMNRNELIWNAQLAQTFLKGAATLSFEMYDILKEQSNITRSLTSNGRTVYEFNGVNSYCMVHFIYRLNLFGGKEARGRAMQNGRGGMGGPGFGGSGRRPF